MAYISSVGPVDPETGEVVSGEIKSQSRQCMVNLKAALEEHGSSLEEIVWANWSLREGSEFDKFYEEWLRWFPGEAPVGQGTLMPLSHRRAGFRVSVGVIAATAAAPMGTGEATARIPAVISVARTGGATVPEGTGTPPADAATPSETEKTTAQ